MYCPHAENLAKQYVLMALISFSVLNLAFGTTIYYFQAIHTCSPQGQRLLLPFDAGNQQIWVSSVAHHTDSSWYSSTQLVVKASRF
jgi:hypothetical protein